MPLAGVRRQRRLGMVDHVHSQPPTEDILARLLLGGATDFHATSGRLWITGRAPSGNEFEIHYWRVQGYIVTRQPLPGQLAPLLGVFPTWEAAVDCALQA